MGAMTVAARETAGRTGERSGPRAPADTVPAGDRGDRIRSGVEHGVPCDRLLAGTRVDGAVDSLAPGAVMARLAGSEHCGCWEQHDAIGWRLMDQVARRALLARCRVAPVRARRIVHARAVTAGTRPACAGLIVGMGGRHDAKHRDAQDPPDEQPPCGHDQMRPPPLHGAREHGHADDNKETAIAPLVSAGQSHHLHSPIPLVSDQGEAPEDADVVREVPLT